MHDRPTYGAKLDRIEDEPGRAAVRQRLLRRQHEAHHVHHDEQHRHRLEEHARLVVRLQEVVQPTPESGSGSDIPTYVYIYMIYTVAILYIRAEYNKISEWGGACVLNLKT